VIKKTVVNTELRHIRVPDSVHLSYIFSSSLIAYLEQIFGGHRCGFWSNWSTTEIYALLRCHAAYRGADKSLARPGRIQATATEDFAVRISYL